MASLNTLRTKFGYVLSGVIAFALLAFIFSLKNEMGFSGNDPEVGKINGKSITYTKYLAEYESMKQQSGLTESTEQEAAQLASATWQSLISKNLIIPGLEQMGITMSDEERMAVINGEISTQTFSSMFMNPSTGLYNVEAINNFLSQAAIHPEAEAAWNTINEQARTERMTTKYLGLLRGGAYVNKLEVASGVDAANESFSGQWIRKSYTDMADSLYSVSNSEIKAYYNERKAAYKKLPSRSISYVSFDVTPTPEDLVAIENEVLEVGKNFEAAENVTAFTRENRYGSIANNFRTAAQMTDDEAAALTAGEQYGPINNNNLWTMSRVAESKMAPDTIGVRVIALQYTQTELADSLETLVKGGADFAELATNYSLDQRSAQNGGDMGELPFSSYPDYMSEKLSDVKSGDYVKIESGDMILMMNVYRADAPSTHYRVATIEYPIVASEATRRDTHSKAGLFSVDAKSSIQNFNSSASKAAVTAATAQISAGERSVRGIADSRAVARWAFGAEVGEISEIFKTESGYVVAMLSEVDDSEYRSLESVASTIRSILIRDKKFAAMSGEVSGSTIEAAAKSIGSEVKNFENVKFSSFYIPELGVEAALIGAISAADKGVLSAPIQGMSGMYLFVVDDVVAGEDQTAEAERVRAQAAAETAIQNGSFNALQEMGNIVDLRGEFL